MRNKIYKIASLYSFFTFKEDLIHELKNSLLKIEKNNDLSGLLVIADEGIRFDASLDKLSGLKTVIENGVITAGNASQITDGAAAVAP